MQLNYLVRQKELLFQRVGFTSWLSPDAALNSIRINYESILVDLENTVAKGKSSNLTCLTATRLLKHYKSYEFFQGINFLSEVLAIVSKLNMYLQKT